MRVDLTGRRFGRRVVTSDKRTVGPDAKVLCRCDCGSLDAVRVKSLLAGHCQMCLTCLRGDFNPARVHGRTGSPEHRSFTGMHQRCSGQSERAVYKNIEVCERWNWATGFENFLTDMGPKPTPRHSLDRIDNAKGYEPDNCRWATPNQQARNRHNTTLLTAQGQTRPVSEWADLLKIDYHTLRMRMRLGWTAEEVVAGRREVPVDRSRRFFRVEGQDVSLADCAERAGVTKATFLGRIKLGWTVEEALQGHRS